MAVALLALGGPLGLDRAMAAGQDLTSMTNADRVSRGLKALSTASDLQSFAQQRADEMAKSKRLAHTTGLGSKVSGWQRLGENVGRGPTLQEIQTAFMNSPSHRENILDRDFTQLGVGVTFDGNQHLYVAVIFRLPAGAAASAPPPKPAPKPAPTPTTRASQAPKPKPTTTTQAPTTTTQAPTTTTTAAPPPPPPVEEIVAPPVEIPPPPVETTTTTAARPITRHKDFVAANFSDRIVPASATSPAPVPAPPAGDSAVTMIVTAGLGVLMGGAGTATALRMRARRPKGV
jgi:hypothetical protein